MDLRDEIQRIALGSPSYGRPRITAELKRRGWKVNHKRFIGSCARITCFACDDGNFMVTTDPDHNRPCIRIWRGMVLTGIDQLWVADTTTSDWNSSSFIRRDAGRLFAGDLHRQFHPKTVPG